MPHAFPVPPSGGSSMHEVTDVSIWKDDGPTIHLKHGLLEEKDKHIAIIVPTSRLEGDDNCPKFPTDYEIHVSDTDRSYSDDPTVYKGTVSSAVSKIDNCDRKRTVFRCEPVELEVDL